MLSERIHLISGNAIPSVCALKDFFYSTALTESTWQKQGGRSYITLCFRYDIMFECEKKRRKLKEAALEWLLRSRATGTWSVGARARDLKSVLDPLRRQIYCFSTHGVIVLSAALQSEHNFPHGRFWRDGQSWTHRGSKHLHRVSCIKRLLMWNLPLNKI